MKLVSKIALSAIDDKKAIQLIQQKRIHMEQTKT